MNIYKINDQLRVRLGNWGFVKSVLLLERRKRFLFFYYWQKIEFTYTSIHLDLEDAVRFLLSQSKAELSDGDINKAFKK